MLYPVGAICTSVRQYVPFPIVVQYSDSSGWILAYNIGIIFGGLRFAFWGNCTFGPFVVQCHMLKLLKSTLAFQELFSKTTGWFTSKLDGGRGDLRGPKCAIGVTGLWPTFGAESYTQITFVYAFSFPEYSLKLLGG